MFEFVWNLHQDNRIAGAQIDATNAKHDVRWCKRRIEELEFSLDRLTLASQALWELVRDRAGITEEELLAKIHEIDLRDGVEDQRITPHPSKCAGCGRPLSAKKSRCVYCGTNVSKPQAFP